jgi:hypothetical protein
MHRTSIGVMEIRLLDAKARATGMSSRRVARIPGLKREEKLMLALRQLMVIGLNGG